MRVLLVEDEADQAEAIRRSLRREEGFEVLHVQAARDVPASGFDAAVIDHRLPDGSGTEVVRRLRSIGFEGRIVLVSAVQSDTLVEAAYAAGADDFVVKTSRYRDRLMDALGARHASA